MAVCSIAVPPDLKRDQARAEHQRCHDRYMRHVRRCDECVGRLCPTGRRLEIDADAAGYRLVDAF